MNNKNYYSLEVFKSIFLPNSYDESYHEVTVTAQDFILMILRPLIPSNYKIIRYYGFYRKKHKLHNKMVLLIDKAKRKVRKTLLSHSLSILKYFK